MLSQTADRSRPLGIAGAAGLAGLYAVVLLAAAATIAYDEVSGSGHIGTEHLQGAAERGVAFVVALVAAGGVLLGVGATRVLTSGRCGLLAAPLAALLVIGLIGETIDAVGSATATSDAIGVAILVLAAVPLVLLAIPSSREWSGGVRRAWRPR